MHRLAHLHVSDVLIMTAYFAVTILIGILVKRRVRSSTDYFQAGRAMPTWIAAIAFISANLGAQEVIGMGASGAKYGLATCHFYWLAVPAMVFVGLYMMPFYYGSRARSVPEYLRLRFDEKTRALNGMTFAVMTIFSSGVSMYAMGELLYLLLGWDFNISVLVAAAIVLSYVSLGGLTSAIYNEVLQFFLIVLGLSPLVFFGLRSVGGWTGLQQRLAVHSIQGGYSAGAYTHVWRYLASSHQNPIGVEWIGLGMGLGFVLSFGYRCTDFLVIQRAMAAETQESARRVPLVASIPKMIFPILVILPGMIAVVASPLKNSRPSPAPEIQQSVMSTLGILPAKLTAEGKVELDRNGKPIPDYDLASRAGILDGNCRVYGMRPGHGSGQSAHASTRGTVAARACLFNDSEASRNGEQMVSPAGSSRCSGADCCDRAQSLLLLVKAFGNPSFSQRSREENV